MVAIEEAFGGLIFKETWNDEKCHAIHYTHRHAINLHIFSNTISTIGQQQIKMIMPLIVPESSLARGVGVQHIFELQIITTIHLSGGHHNHSS